MDTQTLCIHRVNMNIRQEHIRKTIENLHIGNILKIDIVSKNKNKETDPYNMVFVHLKWNSTENATYAKHLLSSGKEIKIFYDTFWFWKLFAYNKVQIK